MLRGLEDISYTSNGKENIDEARENRIGGIILMSHMGNWEIATHVLKAEGFKFLLYMGIKQKEQIERMKKKHLSLSGIEVIAIDQDSSSPFAIMLVKSSSYSSSQGIRQEPSCLPGYGVPHSHTDSPAKDTNQDPPASSRNLEPQDKPLG